MKERPKRRRRKDNPYILNFNTINKVYTVSFKDVKGNMQMVEVNEEIYNINEKLKNAINKLSLVQKRRIEMYYFKGLSQREIAEKEGVSLRAVQYTLNKAISELKKILKN